MLRSAMMAGLVLAAVPLAGCADGYYGDRYGYGRPYHSSSYHPRSYGWYDGYYGAIYRGYWGRGGFYYYRLHARDHWRRDDGRHFRRGDRPHGKWRRWDRDDRRDHDHDHDDD